jgi:hypothetical protein
VSRRNNDRPVRNFHHRSSIPPFGRWRAPSIPSALSAKHAIAAAVDKQQPFSRIDGETARIGDTVIIAERAEGFAIAIKGEKCASRRSSRLRW